MKNIGELASLPGPAFLAIGVFDGVHLGHRAVLERALLDARAAGGTAVAVTFDPHPARILRPEKAPHLLTSTAHKLRLIHALGVAHVLVLGFDAAFAATPPEEFIRALAAACRPLRGICVGHEWAFGKGRAGNLALLARLGSELSFDETGVPAVAFEGEPISSTRIRRAIEAGDLARATQMLGREYTILGTVVRGAQLGRELGFPTANLAAHNEQFPPDGVYAIEARHDGMRRPGVANIGTRPTLARPDGERLLEAHLFDFDGGLYGEELEIAFRGHLRTEQRFPSLDALREQITRDAQAARTLLGA